MTTTLATRKQSEAIRTRMQQIRNDLPYDVETARQQVRQLTDWRYQFRKHPLAMMTAAAVLGYLVVPRARTERPIIVQSKNGPPMAPPMPAKRGFVGGLVAAATTIALKSGTSMLTQHLSQTLLNASARGGPSRPEATPYASSPQSVGSEVLS